MSNLTIRHEIVFRLGMTLNESEARALDALVGYGTDGFLKVFYEKMGRAYLEPHEAGLRSLFEQIRREVPPALSLVDRARNKLEAALDGRAK